MPMPSPVSQATWSVGSTVDANPSARLSAFTPSSQDPLRPPSRSSSIRQVVHTSPSMSSISQVNGTIPLPPSHPFANPSPLTAPSLMSRGSSSTDASAKTSPDGYFVLPLPTTRSGPLPPRRGDRDITPPFSLKAKEEALRLREEEVRKREELAKREEALLAREEALREREAMLLAREAASSRGSSFSSPRRSTSGSIPQHLLASGMFAPSDMERPLPPVPGTTRAGGGSIDSYSIRTPEELQHSPDVEVVGLNQDPKSLSSPRVDTSLNKVTTRGSTSSAPPSTVATASQKSNKKKKKPKFSVDGLPDEDTLNKTASCLLRNEDGEVLSFGDLFPHPDLPLTAEEEAQGLPPVTRTVALFIRTWWCGQCQDYTLTSISQIDQDACRREGVRVVVIGIGPWRIAKPYRELMKCPVPIYITESVKLYKLLGMTTSQSFGPWFKGREEYHRYNLPTQIMHGFHNAIFKLPSSLPSAISQLGGEFILTPGYTCEFAHRMTHRSNHMLAPDVVRLAGVAHPTFREAKAVSIEDSQQAELNKLAAEMERWRDEREAELERIRRKKAERRGRAYEGGAGRVSATDGSNPVQLGAALTKPRGSLTGSHSTGADDEDEESMLGFDEFLSRPPPPGAVCEYTQRKMSGIGSPSQSLSQINLEFGEDFAVDEKLQDRFAEVMALREQRGSIATR